jgi:hypothetical protein
MYNVLTPDLCDPLLLAESTVPPIHEVVGLQEGEIKVTYDPTLKRPVRIKPSDDAVFNAEDARRRVAEMVETLNDAGPPFSVSFMKAKVRRPSSQPYPLDLMMTVAGLQLFYLRAQSCIDLVGETIQVLVSLSMPSDGRGPVRAEVNCYLAGDLPGAKEQALQEYHAAVQPFWARLAKTVLGYWALDNGVTEFRLTANILVDPREAMSAIGQPVEEPAEVSVH